MLAIGRRACLARAVCLHATAFCGACVVQLLAPATARAQADEARLAPVTAYRPGAADPAELPVPRFLEFELGFNHMRADDRSRVDGLEYLFKYAFNADMGVLVGGNGYVRHDPEAPGETREGIGDTEIAWKQRFGVREASAFGFILGLQFPTADEGLGEKGEVYSLTGIYSVDIGELRLDANLGGGVFEHAEPGVSRWETEASLAAGWDLAPELEIGFDLSGVARKGEPDTALLLASLAWSLHPRLVLDAGVSHGLGREAEDFTVFTGLSVSLGRL